MTARRWHILGIAGILILSIIAFFPSEVKKIIAGAPEDIIFNLGANLTQQNKRTNILLLGIGGLEHDGGELTDTIIIASLNHPRKSVEMISIPRDLMIKNFAREVYDPEYVKVNMAYWLGKKQNPENRFQGLQTSMKDITGLDMHYAMLIDFKGFAELIDALGGVIVEVENTFTDRQYPNSSFGYMTINFQEGPQIMSGKKALQYVRSRHGNNGEEGDFARSKRQQNLINAIREKALSLELLTSPTKLEDIYNTLQKNIITNIAVRELISLAKFGKDLDRANITKLNIKEGEDGLLHVPLRSFRDKYFGGAYGLFPDGETFTYIQKLIETFLDDPGIIDTDYNVEILNGSTTAGLANETSIPLKSRGIKILRTANTYNKKKYQKSVIIDRSMGTKPDQIAQIRTLTGIHNVTTENIEPNLYRADATVIIGKDY